MRRTRGEVSIDVTRDGKFYVEGPLGIVKTDRVLDLLGEVTGVRIYHHDTDYEEHLGGTAPPGFWKSCVSPLGPVQ